MRSGPSTATADIAPISTSAGRGTKPRETYGSAAIAAENPEAKERVRKFLEKRAAKVAKASNDGHTLLLHHIGMSTSPALYRKLPYNTLEDFEFLGMINDVPMTLIGRPTLPANNYKELSAWIEANKESGQSFENFLTRAGRLVPDRRRNKIYLQPIQAGEHNVEHDKIGPVSTDHLKAVLPIFGGEYLVAHPC